MISRQRRARSSIIPVASFRIRYAEQRSQHRQHPLRARGIKLRTTCLAAHARRGDLFPDQAPFPQREGGEGAANEREQRGKDFGQALRTPRSSTIRHSR